MAGAVSRLLAAMAAGCMSLALVGPAWSQESLDICAQLSPAEVSSLLGGAVVTPRPASAAELPGLATTAGGVEPVPPTAEAPAAPASDIPLSVSRAACSYLTTSAGNTGFPPSQVQLTIDRFQDPASASQAFDARRRALRLVRPAAGMDDLSMEKDEEGSRTFSAETTALSVRGETLVTLSIIDFAVLVRGKGNPAVMERARLLARRIARM